jgi:uncharacterized protein
MMSEINENTPWYKQWMVWMVIAPPFAAVVAGIITINLAIVSDDGLVVDDYYKQGLGINQTLQRDQLARDMELKASLFVDSKELKLRFAGDISDQQLTLSFVHPTQGSRDVILSMTLFAENSYQAKLEKQLTGNWNLLIEPKDKSWRLMGRINLPGETSSALMPNLK